MDQLIALALILVLGVRPQIIKLVTNLLQGRLLRLLRHFVLAHLLNIAALLLHLVELALYLLVDSDQVPFIELRRGKQLIHFELYELVQLVLEIDGAGVLVAELENYQVLQLKPFLHFSEVCLVLLRRRELAGTFGAWES